MAIDTEALFSACAASVRCLSMTDSQFGDVLRRLLGSLVRFDHVVIFAYRGGEKPIELYSTFDTGEHFIFVTLYQDGAYLLDPFFGAVREEQSGLMRMRELAPDRFFSSEYYRSYYVQTGLAEEVGFFVPVGHDVTVVFSLMRREKTGAFPAVEFALLKKIEPFIAALLRQSWGDLSSRFDLQSQAGASRISRQAENEPNAGAHPVWHRLNLTAREAAIVELVLQGHSSESIGLRLKISTGTVKVHRRNVYRKLGISSQSQLLALYLESLKTSSGTSG